MRRRWSRPVKPGAGEGGTVLPLVAVMLVALLGLVALSIDIGRLAVNRRQVQNGVDAAALAGVQVLPKYPDEARAAAFDWAARNNVPAGQISEVTVRSTSSTNDTIEVTARRLVSYSFARAMGLVSRDVTATATAIVGSVVGGKGVMPFGLLDLNGPGTPGFGYTFGQQVTLKEVPGNFFGPGNYGFLALDGRGGSTMRQTIAQGGSDTFYNIGDKVNTEPGQKTGPVTQGLNEWAASHNDSMSSECNDWNTAHSYDHGKLAIKAKCRYRVVLIPIIDYWPNGRKAVTILGFAQMYLAGWDPNNGKAINAIFLDDTWAHPNVKFGPLNSWGTRIVKLLK
jgi:hypothetical protein